MENSKKPVQICRKDMQCTCSMCLASFQATWDLRRPLSSSNAFQSGSDFEEKYAEDFRTPPLRRLKRGKENDPPKSNDEKICRPLTPFMLRSPMPKPLEQPIGRSPFPDRTRDGKCKTATGRRYWPTGILLLLFAVMVILVPRVMLRLYPRALTGDEVGAMVLESTARLNLVDRLDYMQRRLSQSVPLQFARNCTGSVSVWTLKDAGSLVHSECNFYSSPAESVKLWGSPVAATGLLGRGARDRSFTVISGRVLEWREGQVEHEIHREGESWVFPQLAASVIQLDRSTWVVEYHEGLLSGFRSFWGPWYLLKHHLYRFAVELKGSFDAASLAYSRVTYKPGSEQSPTVPK